MSPLAEALLLVCEEEESTTTVEALRNAALAKIVSGEDKSLVNSSVNGKSFGFTISKPAHEILSEATQALQAYRGNSYTATEADFSGIL